MKIYAIYKGDKFLFEGTSKECAEFLDVERTTIRYYNTQAYKRRCEGTRRNGKPRNRIWVISFKEESTEDE